MTTKKKLSSRRLDRREAMAAEDAYAAYSVIEPVWGDDSELVEEWFEEGERLEADSADWIYWVDLYKDRVDRSDLVVHWLRCLVNPSLPRPSQLKPA